MPQIYPTPSSSVQSLTINTSSPLTGGGPVSLGGSITLGISTSTSSTRNAYAVDPTSDGTTANFTIVGAPANLNIEYADVYVDGQIQPADVYTVTANILSLNTAPTSGQEVFLAFSSPDDNRQQYTLTPVTATTFSFPTAQPQGTYVDIYDGNGVFQNDGTQYFLDILNGVYSVAFMSAPVQPVIAVFDPSVNSGRQEYSLDPPADGTTTAFTISGGAPSTSYIDIFDDGLFQMDTVEYSLSFLSGKWTITFTTAPISGHVLTAVFAPAAILPPAQTGGSGSGVTDLNTLTGSLSLTSTGATVTITPSGSTINLEAVGAGSGVSSLQTETGAITLTSSGSTVVITTPTSGTINLEAVGTTGLPVNDPTFTGTLTGPHYATNGSTTSLTPGPGAGGASFSIGSSNDCAGNFSIFTTAIPGATNGQICSINFVTAYPTSPNIFLMAQTADAVGSPIYVVGNTTDFTVFSSSPLGTSVTITFYYFVIQ